MTETPKTKKLRRTTVIGTSTLGLLGIFLAVGLILVIVGFLVMPDSVAHRGYLTFTNDWEYFGFTRAVVENDLRTTDYEIMGTDPVTGRPDVVYVNVVLDRDAEFYYGEEALPNLDQRLGAGGWDTWSMAFLMVGWLLLFVAALSLLPGIFWPKWYTHSLKVDIVPIEELKPPADQEAEKADGQ